MQDELPLVTDWLNSKPVYYNVRTRKVGRVPATLIDHEDLVFHSEGLANYLAYGYSVFGQTPLENLKFLAPCERISRDKDGELVIEKMDDPVDRYESYRDSEEEIVSRVSEAIETRFAQLAFDEELILPLSGGFDSRLLAALIPKGVPTRCFTYGLSENQSESFEVMRAKAVADRLGLQWQRVELGEYNNLIGEWINRYGPVMHSHGMYQMEFYSKIGQLVDKGCVLSGFFGDVWAGSMIPPDVATDQDVQKMSYSHGLNADCSQLLMPWESELTREYYFQNKGRIADPRFRIISSVRMKSTLISYLLAVPEWLGSQVYTPFLSPEICLSMLNLPESRRRGRRWQVEYFQKKGLYVEQTIRKENRWNDLNRISLDRCPVECLSVSLLSALFQREYIEWINANVNKSGWKYGGYRWPIPLPGARIWKRLRRHDDQLKAYCAYLTIAPIQRILEMKNGVNSYGRGNSN